MYARVVEFTLKPGKEDEFLNALQNQVLPLAKNQPGFVDLMGWVSDDRAEHAFAMTFWKTKEDADRYYRHESPMVAILKPFGENQVVEHYYVPISTAHKLAVSLKASA